MNVSVGVEVMDGVNEGRRVQVIVAEGWGVGVLVAGGGIVFAAVCVSSTAVGVAVKVEGASTPRNVLVMGDQKIRMDKSANMIVIRKNEKNIHQPAV